MYVYKCYQFYAYLAKPTIVTPLIIACLHSSQDIEEYHRQQVNKLPTM